MKFALILATLVSISSATVMCKSYSHGAIKKLCYGTESKGLYIKDPLGDWHKYMNVPQRHYNNMIKLSNPTQYFLNNIRGMYYVQQGVAP